jgi:hypothetical protein
MCCGFSLEIPRLAFFLNIEVLSYLSFYPQKSSTAPSKS